MGLAARIGPRVVAIDVVAIDVVVATACPTGLSLDAIAVVAVVAVVTVTTGSTPRDVAR